MEVVPSGLAGRRLAVVVQDLGVGGAEWQASLLARALKRRAGAYPEVWCFSLFGRNKAILEEAGVPILELSPGGSGGWFLRSVQMARFVAKARRRRPEFLVPFTDHPNRVCGAVWPLVGALGCIWNQRDEGRQITGRPLENMAVRRTTLFACNASSGEEFLRERLGVPGDRIVRVRNWVELSPPRKRPDDWKHDLRLRPDVPLAMMIGNLHQFKDHATLLRSWRIVVDRFGGPTPVLLLAGRPGTESDFLGRLTGELGLDAHVRFLGETDDISGLLATVDLVVHSSVQEGCPNGVLEAMSAGVPVVATGIPGIREALGEEYPALVPERDAEALAAEMIQSLEEPEYRRAMGKRAQSRFDARFSPDKALDDYIGIVERVINEQALRSPFSRWRRAS